MDNKSSKLSSRKFWACLAAFCGSIAASVAALNSPYEAVQVAGIIAGIIAAAASAVVYTMVEGSIDRENVKANGNSTQTTVTLSSSNASVVKDVLSPTSTAPAAEGAAKDGQE